MTQAVLQVPCCLLREGFMVWSSNVLRGISLGTDEPAEDSFHNGFGSQDWED